MLKKARLLTHPTLARQDAPYPKQGRSSAVDPRLTFHASRFTVPWSEARTPLADFFSILLLDLPIVGNLRGRGHRRGNRDLWPLDIRKAACALTFGNPFIIQLVQVLLAMLDGVL